MPTASVIIPTYNGQQTIGPAVHSVLTQNFDDYEILIGDDCSTDQTPQILDYLEKSHTHITAYYWDHNLGIAKNMNKLVKRSTGDILLFLDQDDYWLSSKIEKHVNEHRRSNSSVVYSNYIIVDKNGEELDRTIPPEANSSGTLLVNQLYEQGNFIGTFSAVSVSRYTWETNNGLDERLDVSADYDFWVRLAGSEKFSHINEELASKRKHERNHSDKYRQIHKDNKLILEKSLDLYPHLRGKEKTIRSQQIYHHSNAAFRDGNTQEAINQAIYSLQYKLHIKTIIILLLSIIDFITFSNDLGTKIYYNIYKNTEAQTLLKSIRSSVGWRN